MKEPTRLVGVQRKAAAGPGGFIAEAGFKLGVKGRKVLINKRKSGESLGRRKQPKEIYGERNTNTSLGTTVSSTFPSDIPSSTVSCGSTSGVPKAACYSKGASLVTILGTVEATSQLLVS